MYTGKPAISFFEFFDEAMYLFVRKFISAIHPASSVTYGKVFITLIKGRPQGLFNNMNAQL